MKNRKRKRISEETRTWLMAAEIQLKFAQNSLNRARAACKTGDDWDEPIRQVGLLCQETGMGMAELMDMVRRSDEANF